jgi:hypothetical protein
MKDTNKPLVFKAQTGNEAFAQGVTLSQARHRLCLEAIWEIEALCTSLPAIVPLEGHASPALVMRGITERIVGLSNALLSALDDEMETDVRLARRIMGTERPEGILLSSH